MDSVKDSRPATLWQLLTFSAERWPAAAALVAPDQPLLTHAALLDLVEQIAEAIGAAGLGPNDRIAVCLPQGPEMAVAVLGVAATAVCVPLNPAGRIAEHEAYLAETEVRAVLVAADDRTAASGAAHALGLPVLTAMLRGVVDRPRRREGNKGVNPGSRPGAHALALVLPTSGTTSRPKRVPLTQANVVASAHHIATTLDLSPTDRCLAVMPFFHIHGLMVMLAALASGGSVACPGPFDPSGFGEWLDILAPTWYSAVPTMHHAVVAHADLVPGAPALRRIRFVRSSSAPLPPRLGRDLETLFGAPVIEAYGMTEAAHQIASNPLPPSERRPGSVGRAAGTELSVLDEDGRAVDTGVVGEIHIRGESVTAGYEGGDDSDAPRPGGWLPTGDLGWLDGDGYLHLAGRRKELVNRGGQKIAPPEVEEVLIAHPGVAEAVVFPVPHPTLGEEVGAAVTLHPAAVVTTQQLRDFALERLADYKVPARVHILDRLPLGPTGKVQRARMAELLGVMAPASASPAPPVSPAEVTVARIWREMLGVDVGRADDFFALGGDSLMALRMLRRLERECAVRLPVAAIFRAPTVSGLAAAVELASQQASPTVPSSSEPPEGRPRVFPLSLAQRRLWFLEQLEPASSVYNEPAALRLDGPLDERALQCALDEIVTRHESLRTVFVAEGGEPRQLVQPPRAVDLALLDFSTLDAETRAAALARALHDTAVQPFDLTTDLMLRARLVRLGEAEHVLALVMHHIASDARSWITLYGELGALYESHRRRAPSPLPALPVQYGDLAMWQRERLEGAELERQLAYWRQKLAGAPEELGLPTDRPRPEAPSHAGARVKRVMPAALGEALRKLAQGEHATLFMALLAGLFALLHRYTGREDMVVATPTEGRTQAEAESLIGFFVGTLALRADLRGDPTARGLLRRVRETSLGAYAHQDAPFESLVAELAPERTLRRNPIVQVLLILRAAGRDMLDLSGLSVTPLPMATDRAKLDLSVHVTETPEGLAVEVIYSTELFDPDTIERFLEHYELTLRAMVDDPEARVSHLPILAPWERRQLLVDWNDTARVVDRPSTIHGLVAAQAKRTPDATALVWRNGEMAYGDLDGEANQLARHLRALGAGPERTVAVLSRRSPVLVVALLAVLKTGAAYVPLDPAWPDERLRVLLDDSGAGILLAESELVARVGEPPAQVVLLDRDRSRWRAQSRSEVDSPTGAADLAYLAYTSGSTGRPKGILCTHGGAANYLAFVLGTYGLGPTDTIVPRSSIAFDATVREIFGTLAAGARLVLLDDDELRDPRLLLQAVRTHGATVLTLVPSLLRACALVAEEGSGPAPSLRLLLVSGEPLFTADVRRARNALAPEAEVVNQYGPSECTIISAYHRARADGSDGVGVPIGRPVWNARLYVLDQRRQLVPIGVPGELYIGGAGVARGYLGLPELTAERFLPDPFHAAPGARMYRTGDLVRYRRDGILEIQGRTDNQMKIRGNRIEPEEIEAVIRRRRGVRDAAVATWPAGQPEADLVAYVVPETPAAISAAEVRAHVRAHLPRFMEPRYIEFLPALPLSPIGKLDRQALPAPVAGLRMDESTYVEPRTPLEWQIARIWEELLGTGPVSALADFFDLGGHSLLAVRMMQALERECGRHLPLTALFSAPTVEGLALALLQQEATTFRDPVVSLKANGDRPPFFFLHGDYNGGGFYSRTLARGVDPEQPFYAIHPHPLIDLPIRPTLEAMAADLVTVVRRVQPTGPYRLGGHCNGGVVAFEMARQLESAGERVEALILIDASARNVKPRGLRRLKTALSRALGLSAGARAAPDDAWLADQAPGVWEETERVRAYLRVLRQFVPKPYRGRVDLLVPEARLGLRTDLGWLRVARSVVVHSVPGQHLTAITRHGPAVAERVRDCLRRC